MMNIEDHKSEEIAVIGIAGRFPGAKNIKEFWQNLREGVESTSTFTDEELIASGIHDDLLKNSNYVKVGAIVEDIELFDAPFFNFNLREAETTEPQHRLFLECAWEALEAAGYNSQRDESRIGVYAGASVNNYLAFDLNRDQIGSVNSLQTLIGNDKDFLATRVSYKLNLRGPSLTVQTACSTSLVATALACQSLLNYQCDIALVGGVSIRVPQKSGYLHQEGSILSPDGHCRAFDAKARGTIIGNGVGVVVLKRLTEAITDGDCIDAVIKGSAINNDGSFKVGYTAPSMDGQAEVIAEAQALAGIRAETVSYIEAHGSGTALGDPIEIAALKRVFQASTDKKGFCAIGSVKTNIGHLDAAAGVTGLIKTILALKHKQIPPSLNFKEPNPEIDFTNSPFYVNTTLSEWKTEGAPRRAGVSAFGLGGTNAHIILEEAPVVAASSSSRSWQILMLSAKSSLALETAKENLTDYLNQHPELNLADVAYTLQVGRRAFDHRQMMVCRDRKDALAALQDPKRVFTSLEETSDRPIAFMFTGLGTHYINMAEELIQVEPIFQEVVDYCCQFLKPILGLDLIDVIYPHKNREISSVRSSSTSKSQSDLNLRQMLGRDKEQFDKVTQRLNETYLTQPAIFIIEYALAQLWMSWGIHPVAMIGYSIGEYVAATLAGVLSLEDALTLVAKRAQMIQELPEGAMLAVPLAEEEVRPLLNKNLSLSAINGSSLCVIAGTIEAVDELEGLLTERGLACRRLLTSHAFHSHMMEPMAASFTELVKTSNLQPPKIPYISNVTGTWITAEQATNPYYWTQHLCQPVCFAEGINQLWKKRNPILLEVGPGQTLGSLALQCLQSDSTSDKVILCSLRHSYDQQSDVAYLLNSLGQLWLSGVRIDWSGFYANEHRHRIPLPTYPFERQRYWIEPQKQTSEVNSGVLKPRLDITEWFHMPSWKRVVLPVYVQPGQLSNIQQCWLILADDCGVGSPIAEQLKCENQEVIVVRVGERFCRLNEQEYLINPGSKEDYNALIKELCTLKKIPQVIVHLWNITADEGKQLELEDLEQTQTLSFYSLLFLAQALGENNITDPLKIDIVSNNMQEVFDSSKLCPEKALLLGPCKVISQEYSNITCRSIDITLPQLEIGQWQYLIDQLLTELVAKTSDKVIAYRGNHRWVQCFEPLSVEGKTLSKVKLRQGGVYIITGGLGGLGLAIAQHLAKTVQAKLVLIGRSGLLPKSEWEQWLSSHEDDDPVSIKIKGVQAIEEFGAEVLVIRADVTHLDQMQAMVGRVHDRFGKIHGIIHTAGVASGNIVQLKTTELAASVLNPKVKGTLILDTALKEEKLDFWVLFSSMSAIMGGLGQVDYCAASAFLDAFAQYNFYQRNIHTVSINWDSWQVNNLQDAFMSFSPEIQAGLRQMRERYGITFDEGIDALWHILLSQQPQVIVSTRDLQTILEEDDVLAAASLLESIEKLRPQSTQLRPNLKTVYVAPRSEMECKIAELYQELLGIEQIGIHDNFFDVGGNSLIGIQLISRLRQEFQVKPSLQFIFEAPSVAELALIIEEMCIREIEELTEDEAEEIVSVLAQQEPENLRR